MNTQSFRHGIHPAAHKDAADLPIERLPFSRRFTLPLAQNLGAPAKALVTAHQKVARGERIGDPSGYVSVALHAPVAGHVVSVGRRRHPTGALLDAIEIEADPFSTQRVDCTDKIDPESLTQQQFIEHAQAAGLVGMGGAAFPSHVKYAPPEDKPVKWLVLNGSECEPYLTCDHRVMVERPQDVIRGGSILAKQLGAEGVKIGVEMNKREAIDALQAAIGSRTHFEVVPLRVKYPQGAEKMLIKAIFAREVPGGKLPLDIGIVVNNVATMTAMANYFDRGMPLIERVLTVAGTGIDRPANLIVPIGTPVRDVLDHCGLNASTQQVIMGGPMMGQPLSSLDVPVLKGTSGLLAFTETDVANQQEYTCIRCGRCLDACANFLNPSRLARLAKARLYDQMEGQFVKDCMECGGCSYACPSGIPIVQLIRVAKGALRERDQKKPGKD